MVQMVLRDIMRAHLTLNGQNPSEKDVIRFQDQMEGHGVDNGRITDMIQFIAAATGKSDQTVWNWFRQAEMGIGSDPTQLDPTIAMALMFLSNQVLVDNDRPINDDAVADYLDDKLYHYYKARFPKRRRSKTNDRGSKSRGKSK